MSHREKNFIAVDLGGTNLRAALVNEKGAVLKKKTVPTPQTGGRRALTAAIIDAIKKLGKQSLSSAQAVGISVAGPIDTENGTFSPPTLKLSDVPIVKPLERAFALPTCVINDAKAAVYAEYTIGHGKGEKIRNLVYITISSGIGVGAIVDDRLLLGRDSSAGELGHAAVSNAYDRESGSWEHYCAGKKDPRKGIVFFYTTWCAATGEEIDTKIKEPQDIFRLAKNGNKQIKKFLRVIGALNAQGTTTVMLAYNPQIIVFGGGIGYNHWRLLGPEIKKNIRKDIFTPVPKIVRTNLGDDISLIGSALWARDSLS